MLKNVWQEKWDPQKQNKQKQKQGPWQTLNGMGRLPVTQLQSSVLRTNQVHTKTVLQDGREERKGGEKEGGEEERREEEMEGRGGEGKKKSIRGKYLWVSQDFGLRKTSSHWIHPAWRTPKKSHRAFLPRWKLEQREGVNPRKLWVEGPESETYQLRRWPLKWTEERNRGQARKRFSSEGKKENERMRKSHHSPSRRCRTCWNASTLVLGARGNLDCLSMLAGSCSLSTQKAEAGAWLWMPV